MRSYIRRSPLTSWLAVSFVFVLFVPGVSGREAARSIEPARIARQQPLPCVFDNFVWFKDQEIIDEIRKDLPSFDGSAPEAGDSINKILAALKRMLKSKNLPSEVEYTFFSGDGYRYGQEH